VHHKGIAELWERLICRSQ